MPDDFTITLPAHCGHCGKQVTLQMSSWPVAVIRDTLAPTDPPPDHQQAWACPWCHWENAGGFADRLAWARKGHQSSA